MPRIGPFSFTTLSGRILSASSPTLATTRGLRPLAPRPVVSTLTSTEACASHAAAWLNAWTYRQAVGYAVSVVDDGDGFCAGAVVVDVRTRVDHSPTGATLTTSWSLVPSPSFGTVGQPILAGEEGPANAVPTPAPPVTTGTTYSVGGLTGDAATGDVQWPLPPDAKRRVETALLAIGASGVGAPSLAGGALTLWRYEDSYSSSFVAMDASRLVVGTLQDVTIAGVVLFGCPIASSAPTWSPGVGLPTGKTYVWTATFGLELSDDQTDSGDRPPHDIVVEYAEAWGAWKRLPNASCSDASEGVGQSAGHCSVLVDLSPTLRGRRVRTSLPIDYSGKWIRLRSVSPTNGGTQAQWQVGDPIWYGVALAQADSSGREVLATSRITCAGMAHALQSLEFSRWYYYSSSGDADGDFDEFNASPSGDAATGTGSAPKVIRVDASSPARWTGLQILQLIIYALRDQYPLGPLWALGGQTTALGDVEAHKLQGMTALEAIAEIINPRRGLTFKIEVSGTTATINVRTTQAVAIVEAAQGINIPANDRLTSILDLTGTAFPGVELVKDRGQEYDDIMIEGGNPTFTTTLAFSDAATVDPGKFALEKGWTDAQETAWLAAGSDERGGPELSHVWRRFKLRDNYAGTGYYHPAINRTLRMVRSTASDNTHGSVGETGVLTESGSIVPEAKALRFDRLLPIWDGVDWTTPDQYPYQSDQVQLGAVRGWTSLRARKPPLIFARPGGGGSITPLTDRYAVTVEDDMPAVTIGHTVEDAVALWLLLVDGAYELNLTIAIVHPMKWRVSWRRNSTQKPRDQRRSIILRAPRETYSGICAGTLIGIDDTGAAVQVTPAGGADHTFIGWGCPNDPAVPRLDPLLRLSRLWYETGPRSATWQKNGEIDTTTATAPGSVIADVKYRLDKDRTNQTTLNTLITSRSWDFEDRITTYQAERLQVGSGYSIIPAAPKRLPNLAAGAGAIGKGSK